MRGSPLCRHRREGSSVIGGVGVGGVRNRNEMEENKRVGDSWDRIQHVGKPVAKCNNPLVEMACSLSNYDLFVRRFRNRNVRNRSQQSGSETGQPIAFN